MNSLCDGGGNRYSSQVELKPGHPLRPIFDGIRDLPAGVCSIQLIKGENPWIVCPRRLLALAREDLGVRQWQKKAQDDTLKVLSYKAGMRLGIWPEVKMKYSETDEETKQRHSFDYTFDYVVAPVGRVRLQTIVDEIGCSQKEIERTLKAGQYTLAQREGALWVEDFPYGSASLIEIMTSSTSGGNKKKRTTVAMAFEDAMLGKEHQAPGINYRQVWARMVSQLIVKSEVALAWGGTTIWVVQDVLADYIRESTALDLNKFLAKSKDEVNMLSFSYGEQFKQPKGILDLKESKLYAGRISSASEDGAPSFSDMIRTPLKPDVWKLFELLARRRPENFAVAP
jgi:hypothetical protein